MKMQKTSVSPEAYKSLTDLVPGMAKLIEPTGPAETKATPEPVEEAVDVYFKPSAKKKAKRAAIRRKAAVARQAEEAKAAKRLKVARGVGSLFDAAP